MKRCPTCNQTFSDQHLSFCVDDGTPLAEFDPQVDETTVVAPPSAASEPHVAPYQPPGSYVPPAPAPGNRKTWPWVLGILAVVLVVFAGLGIAAVVLIPKMVRESANKPASNSNGIVSKIDNSNRNSNSANANTSPSATDENENDNSNEDASPPPTDQQEVLADLKDLEDQWTAANINADKKALNRILADDYVDTSEGKPRGKAEYLKTAQRDMAIQHWEFEDLKASLKGDRATLSGTIRLEVKDQQSQVRPVALTFTDKFVWRDGRWQATGSEVSPLKE